MSNIYVRKAQLQDLPAIMKIIDNAKALLKADGSLQWQDGSPNETTFINDINHGNCWVLKVDNQIAGTATLLTTRMPTTKIFQTVNGKILVHHMLLFTELLFRLTTAECLSASSSYPI